MQFSYQCYKFPHLLFYILWFQTYVYYILVKKSQMTRKAPNFKKSHPRSDLWFFSSETSVGTILKKDQVKCSVF